MTYQSINFTKESKKLNYLKSRFTDIDENMPLAEYPRPQLERDSYICLNGKWLYSICSSESEPSVFDGTITVPFSPETPLSGVMKTLSPDKYLWYKRSFTLPASFMNDRLVIHFGAVDRHAAVFVNGKLAVTHSGGYTPFSADITELVDPDKENILTVRVRDESDHVDNGGKGKQKTDRGGIWYTSQIGIWQTVWLESLPDNYISSIRVTPDVDNSKINIFVESPKKSICTLDLGGKTYGLASNGSISITVKDPILWTPENPHLYYFTVKMGNDLVKSYFAMRKMSLETDKFGKPQLFLNGEPYCQFGLLDQGYHCGGYYTPPSDEAMVYDIALAKTLGFNMLRKHIKVEPLRWYYHCDRLGMLVWQDMVNGGGAYKFSTISLPLFFGSLKSDSSYAKFSRTSKVGRDAFVAEMEETVKTLYSCPSVVVWTLFNEGWGQFDSEKLTSYLRTLDPSRPIDSASGWHDLGFGDITSKHVYFKKYKVGRIKNRRAPALSEFGGYSLHVEGHTFNDKKFGYKTCDTREELTAEMSKLFNEVFDIGEKNGVCAYVYTQLSDVEDEINGIVTYDREVVKPDIRRISSLIKARISAYNKKFR